jgi:CBS domain-containing protein
MELSQGSHINGVAFKADPRAVRVDGLDARRVKMAATVTEIMNAELFYVRAGDTAEDALNGLLALGIGGAPVLDAEGRPVGMVSLRELAERRAGQSVADLMSSPAAALAAQAPIAEAGRLLARSGHHRLVVVDAEGKAVGNVSALDVLRELSGLPAAHPAAFPHFDRKTQLVWTDARPLTLDEIEAAPDGPGLLMLILGAPGLPERVVWAEACRDVYARLVDILSTPQSDRPILARWLERGPLRFRAAPVEDVDRGRSALHRILAA